MVAFGGIKSSRVLGGSIFSNFQSHGRWIVGPEKRFLKGYTTDPKRRLWTFLTSWMQLKPSNPRQRTISAKRVSSKTLQTPSIPKNRPAIGRSEFFGIKEGDTFHPLQKRILFDSRLNLNIENQFLEIPSSTLMGVQ